MLIVDLIRAKFPSLSRQIGGRPCVYLDGPAGSQVPQEVADAISHHILHRNANHGGLFATSVENDAAMDGVRATVASWINAADADCISFGQNMTSLAFSLGRALSKTWKPGDEIVVTHLDHDANVTPWVLAARDAGATVRYVEIHPEDCTLDREQYRSLLNERTRFVALGCVSNAVGTVNPVKEMIAEAHAVGAIIFLDAVHHAPHLKIDVADWDCDFLCCSAYKFFGPHVGILYGKRHWLESLPAYKLRPAPNTLPDRWMTGTQNFAAIAGTGAAVDYMKRVRMDIIAAYERGLAKELIEQLKAIPRLQIYGITDPARMKDRVPTVSFTMQHKTPREVVEHLAAKNIFAWSGNYYALPLTERLGLEPHGMTRVGLLHYNTKEEIGLLAEALSEM